MNMIQSLRDLPKGDCCVHFVMGALGTHSHDCIEHHHKYALGVVGPWWQLCQVTSGQSDWNLIHLLSTSIQVTSKCVWSTTNVNALANSCLIMTSTLESNLLEIHLSKIKIQDDGAFIFLKEIRIRTNARICWNIALTMITWVHVNVIVVSSTLCDWVKSDIVPN